MQCSFCKIGIDDDSLYCDQCGKEILICPKCNNPGKGKMCTIDGTTLVTMKNKMAGTATGVGVSVAVSSVPAQNLGPIPVLDKDELHLINKNLGLDIKIEKDVLIGRTTGDFVDIFSKYQTVSGQHLQINFDLQKGWLVTDLGSTNGTKYNNIPLVPNQPQILSDKSYLIIATIEFYVQILTKKPIGKTGTMRV
jgi:hypothetical protein